MDPLHRQSGGRTAPTAALLPRWSLPVPPPPGGDAVAGEPRIAPDLLRALLEAKPDQVLPIIVTAREQADLGAAVSGALSVVEARSHVVSALQTHAARSQAPLRAYLEGARASGSVASYTPFWVFNGVAVRARPAAISALAVHPAVASVQLDHRRQWIPAGNADPISNLQSPIPTPGQQAAVEWGVARIRADQVWDSLHISGTGAVVAGMDTGVDWLHPALQANYRGYNPHGPANHLYNWYDATAGGASYPVDGYGHGTHTLGTAVGRGGVGVAPGARWIAVKVLDDQGYGYDSWVHGGFQWLLAPGGDPTRSPDVVNCSWGSDNGFLTTFRPDLQALQAAGIFAVFSNGNNGPNAATVGSPASLPEAFAIGATDPEDEVANFSSRGPSPWGDVRPHVAAPGIDIRSSLPGGSYGLLSGTSMAAPHVSGIVALLSSVSPTLSITRTVFLLTSTAVSLGAPLPNNDTGWGRVDAFGAVGALTNPALVAGRVTRAGDGVPVAGATVVATSRGAGGGGRATTDDSGAYLLALAPSSYDLTASAFGYEPATAWGITATAGVTSVVDFALTPLPVGILQGHVTDAATGQPVTATVSVLDTPLEADTSSYAFSLPADTYTVRARALGYRVVTATAVVTVGQATVVDLALPRAPSILLVDSGPWYCGSQAGYFRQALDDLAYAYDEWAIKHIPDDVPTVPDLVPYDIVVWSAPEDAPAYIGAQESITGYLTAGGRLLLSGQDVGFLDGGGAGLAEAPYYRDYLKVSLVRDNAETWTLQGEAGDLFAGLTLTIAGSGGADNQAFPSEIAVADPDAAAPVLAYQGGGCAGVRVGTCLDYRAIYFSFGFEAVNDRALRREVMARALDWLTSPPPAAGIELKPASQMRIGLPGVSVSHTLRVRHVGQGGSSDTVRLSLDGTSWATQLSAPSLSLAPCTSSTVVVSVTIPSSAGWDAWDAITVTARSSLSPTLAEVAILTTKTPAPILLVDDDRWYDQEDKYEAALVASGLAYDYWRTDQAHGEPAAGGPPLDVLQRYPIVVWFTGYDWYAPVTPEEAELLVTYLLGGGRLFLSSQDLLYYHHGDPFSRDYLGVLTYTEDITPTMAWGVPENPIGEWLGSYVLDYPFRNWSDEIVPAPGTVRTRGMGTSLTSVAFRDHERRPIALASQGTDYVDEGDEGDGGGGGDGYIPCIPYVPCRKTVFFSFPFEALPEAGRPEVMERIVGWLSWLGNSTFAADRNAASSGEPITFTATLRNDGPTAVSTSFSNTLPLSLTLVPGSVTGPAVYQAPARSLFWEGSLESGAAITFTYRVTIATGLAAGTAITSTAHIGLEEQGIHFRRPAVVRMGAPDLSLSSFDCSPSPALPATTVACTLALANTGPGDASAAQVNNLLPANTAVVTGSLAWVGGGSAEALDRTVRWTGPLGAGAQVSLTYRLTLPAGLAYLPLYNVVCLEDGLGGAWERPMWVLVRPSWIYLPLIVTSK